MINTHPVKIKMHCISYTWIVCDNKINNIENKLFCNRTYFRTFARF